MKRAYVAKQCRLSQYAFGCALTVVEETTITYALIVSIPRLIFACIGRRNNSLPCAVITIRTCVCGDLTHLTRTAFIVTRNKEVLNSCACAICDLHICSILSKI